MKSYINILPVSFTFLIILCCAENQTPSSISGKVVDNNYNGKIWLKKRKLPKVEFVLIDSLIVDEDGKFEFDASILDPGYYQIFYEDSVNSASAPILWEDGTAHVTIKIDTSYFGNGKNKVKVRKIAVNGANANLLLDKYFDTNKMYYQNYTSSVKKQITKLSEDLDIESLEKLDSLNDLLRKYEELRRNELDNLVLDNMGTSIAVFQTMSQWDETDFKFIDTIVNRFKNQKPNSFITSHIIKKAEELKTKSLINKDAITFTLKNQESQLVSLNQYINKKTILIDFWASWCGPCLKEIPAYKKIYNEFRDDGFEIISISTDKNVEKWKKSSSDNQIPWVNLIDSPVINPTVAHSYKISELPTNYLIDMEGKIIRKNISFPELANYLRLIRK